MAKDPESKPADADTGAAPAPNGPAAAATVKPAPVGERAFKPAADSRTTIRLLAGHEHAGRQYPAGTALVLADIGLLPTSAQWLVTLGKAVWAD